MENIEKNNDVQMLFLQRELLELKKEFEQLIKIIEDDENLIEKLRKLRKTDYQNNDEFFQKTILILYQNGFNIKRISNLLNINYAKIQKILKQQNALNKEDRYERIIKYYNAGMSIRAIEKNCHTSWQTIYKIIKERNLYIKRSPGGVKKDEREIL